MSHIYSWRYHCNDCRHDFLIVRRMTVWRWFNFEHPDCSECGSSDVSVEHEGEPEQHVLDTLGFDG